MPILRSWKFWLTLSAVLFAVYCAALVLFVSGQSRVQRRHMLWSSNHNQRAVSGLQLKADGNILVTESAGGLHELDSTGRELWQTDTIGNLSGYTQGDACLLPDDSVLLIDNGASITPQFGGGTQVVVGGSSPVSLRHFDNQGRELNQITPSFSIDPAKGMLIVDGTVVLADRSGQLHGIDGSGSELWSSSAQAGLLQIEGPDAGILLLDVNSINGAGELALLNGADGTELWRITLPGDFGSSLKCAGKQIYYVDGLGDIRCLDETGAELWTFQDAGSFQVFGIQTLQYASAWNYLTEAICVAQDGTLAALSGNGDLYLLDTLGQELASFRLTDSDGWLALDSQRQRVVHGSYSGYYVYDFSGKLLRRNPLLRVSQRIVLDEDAGHAYLTDGLTLYCMEY